MSFYTEAPVWEDRTSLPNTCKTAKPSKALRVESGRIIKVGQARYRNSEFSGSFLLAETVIGPLPLKGWHKIEVQCCWFGHRLKTRHPQFTVNMETVTECKGGEVYTDISR